MNKTTNSSREQIISAIVASGTVTENDEQLLRSFYNKWYTPSLGGKKIENEKIQRFYVGKTTDPKYRYFPGNCICFEYIENGKPKRRYIRSNLAGFCIGI